MITIVLQGALNKYAVETARQYIGLPFVKTVILSCWNTDKYIEPDNEGIVVLMNELVPNGVGNRNLQIKSSYAGLRLSETEVSVKMRNDQRVRNESMYIMNAYYQADAIYVPGIFPTFPFHPRDHIFWGRTNELLELFDIPYDNESLSDDYTRYMRSEAYIAMWYYAKKNYAAGWMVKNKEDYLLDNSPQRQKAIELSESMKIFKPFPKISFEWPKYGMTEYHYEYTKQLYGEYQAE